MISDVYAQESYNYYKNNPECLGYTFIKYIEHDKHGKHSKSSYQCMVVQLGELVSTVQNSQS